MLRARGFTIVELITVVVLLGILSMTAVSRMVRPSSFAPGIVAQTFVAEARIAQQRAASRRDASVTLTADRLGDDWRFVLSSDVDGVLRTELVEAANTSVTVKSGAASASLDSSASLRLDFTTTGDLSVVLIDGLLGDASGGVALTVVGDTSRDVCVHPTGYAVEGVCV